MTEPSQASAASDAAPRIAIRSKPPSPKRLSRKVLLSGCALVGGVVTFAVLSGLGASAPRAAAKNIEVAASTSGPPDSIRKISEKYGVSDLPLAPPRDMLWGDHKPPIDAAATNLDPPKDQMWSQKPPQVIAVKSETDPLSAARASPILFGASSGSTARDKDSTLYQGPHAAFLSGRGSADDVLPTSLEAPRSQFELLAGALIPAALVTELNSDLPGRVIAQVTAPVYDTVTGDHLLIPQGARLIGTYDAQTTRGEHRLLLVWNRLILPNGWSINLQGMDASDPAGVAGLRDRTDNHLLGLTGAIAAAAIISVIANNSEGEHEDRGLDQSLGEAAAQQAAQTGGKIVDRALDIKPTLRVRAGAPLRVLVTKDIRLRPYTE